MMCQVRIRQISQDVMVGDEASAARRALEISYPMEEGKIKNWDDMEVLWDYTFNDRLRTATKGKSIVLTEPPGNAKASRQKVLQYMFEKYEMDSVSLNVQAMLTLYGIGSVTGLVVDSGDGVTHIVCVADGYVPRHLVTRLDVAGRHVTEYLAKLMLLRGYAFNSTADFATVQEIKEKYCYVAKDPTRERKLALDTTVLLEKFKLPDGQDIKIERERFEAPEALFNPSLIDVERPGLSEMVFQTIQRADIDQRRLYYQNIVLSGGSTMYPGLPTRLEHDIVRMYSDRIAKGNTRIVEDMAITIKDPPKRKHIVFNGAALVGDMLKTNPDFWITKAQYEEEGERVLDKYRTL